MKRLSRRSFLRGASGAVLSLPWMESLSATGTVLQPPRRMAFFYVPIGVVRRGFFPGEMNVATPVFRGGSMQEIRPDKPPVPGIKDLEHLTPTMQPLAGHRDRISLVTGMDRTFQQGTDVHAQCASCFLSSAPPNTIKSSAWPLDRTLDHLVADVIGNQTPFRTLEFSCNSHKDNKESIYFDNISWYGTGHVAPSMRSPRKAYQRMFGKRETDDLRTLTDLVLEDAHSMKRRLGHSDREKFDEYFESIRTIEKQTERLESMRAELATVHVEEPPEARLPRGEYIRLMGDLMVVALQTGLTHVATMMIGPERWDTPFTYDGLFDKPMSHHQMSHNQKEFSAKLLELDRFHMEQFAYLLDRMEGIKEANGSSLLDNTLFTYGSGLGDGSTHQYSDLPIIVAGSGGGRFHTGKHLHCADGTPLANLWLTQARAMGLALERFADSTGTTHALLA